MSICKVLLCSLGFAVSITCRSAEIKADDTLALAPSATEILARAAQVYRDLSSYRDEGSVESVFESVDGGHKGELRFTTAFARSGTFRFEFLDHPMPSMETKYVVWKDGRNVKSWSTLSQDVQLHEDIGYAIAGATGVSANTAYTIPSVLMSDAAWKVRTWTTPEGAYRIADASEGGTACFRIQRLTSVAAQNFGGYQISATKGKATAWVAKDTYLLMRVDDETDFGKFFTRRTTRYKPTINTEIPAAAFEFGH